MVASSWEGHYRIRTNPIVRFCGSASGLTWRHCPGTSRASCQRPGLLPRMQVAVQAVQQEPVCRVLPDEVAGHLQ